MGTIGEAFKGARERMGLTVEEASRRTKLHSSVIESIEENAFEKLPAPLYVIGFIRRYARLLGLNEKDLVNQYIEQNKEASDVSLDIREESVVFENARMKWKGAAAAVVLAGIGVLALFFFDEISELRRRIFGSKEKKEVLQPQDLPAAASAKEASLPPPPAQGGVASVPDEVKKALTVVGIEVLTDVFVSVTEEKNLIFSGVLKGGAKEEWQSQGTIKVRVGAPDCARLYLGGEDKGIVGRDMTSPRVLLITGGQLVVSSPGSLSDD